MTEINYAAVALPIQEEDNRACPLLLAMRAGGLVRITMPDKSAATWIVSHYIHPILVNVETGEATNRRQVLERVNRHLSWGSSRSGPVSAA